MTNYAIIVKTKRKSEDFHFDDESEARAYFDYKIKMTNALKKSASILLKRNGVIIDIVHVDN